MRFSIDRLLTFHFDTKTNSIFNLNLIPLNRFFPFNSQLSLLLVSIVHAQMQSKLLQYLSTKMNGTNKDTEQKLKLSADKAKKRKQNKNEV